MGSQSITSRRNGDTYTCDVSIGQHRLVLDEPVDLGGNDHGPTPVELVTAALGGCTAITMQMYARRKGWTITRLDIEVDHETVNAPTATPEGRISKQDQFRMRIVLDGDLDDDQRARLIGIAKRCPVHRMLAGASVIVDEQVDCFAGDTK